MKTKSIDKYMRNIFFVAIVGLFAGCGQKAVKPGDAGDLQNVKQQVETQLANVTAGFVAQVNAFSRVVANDRDFSMKLLVEKERSAPEVSEMANKYMEPMGFSLLSLVNNRDTLLSCGQFSASVGGPAPEYRLLAGKAAFILDNVKGQQVLTLQAQTKFTILDTVFFATGGVIVDDGFMARFSLPAGYKLLCKQGGTIIGMQGIGSISEVKDNSVVVNNKTYPAVAITLPFAGGGAPPIFIMYCEAKPK